ncbi:MAG TPA: helix-turn-helix domain-containing protein [Bryobacteraceae bacterium]|jgi:HTH-type transcriptional regulator/antitoxin HigA|nr:helix-turn-helix domain-containing protein [Bryobacteraceae bacterium]
MSAVITGIDEVAYRDLLATALPHIIHTEEENDRYIADLEALHNRGHLTREEELLSELLTVLIEDFENKHYQLKPAAPVEIVRELMDANGLKQSDLLDVFGTKSIASEVLSGKRDLSKAHIQKLAERFHVSPELFFPVLRKNG